MGSDYLDENKFNKMLGVYIRESREAKSLSHRQLAKQTRIPIFHLRRIEEGKVKVRKMTLDLLSYYLNLDEVRLDKMREIAKISFVDQLLSLVNLGSEDGIHDLI